MFVSMSATRICSCGLLFGLTGAGSAQALVHRDGSILRGQEAAFDPVRGRLVVGANCGETWECDGARWMQRVAPRTPWDAARLCWVGNGILAFAVTRASLAQTWVYDGFQWEQLPSTGQPPARRSTMLAFDSVRGRAVLFGGIAMVGPNYSLTDTWEWDGAVWTQMAPLASPAWHYDSGFAYDPVRQVAVMFAGNGQTGIAQDTWEWNGTTWAQRSPLVSPSARTGPAMTFDPGLGRVVLHGGLSTVGLQSDLWSFDGVTWQPIAASNVGPGLYQHALHHDPVHNELWTLGDNPLQVSIFAGGTWRAGPPVAYIGATGGPGPAAIDPATGGVVRFGSLFGNGTTVWDRSQWHTLQPQPTPPARIFSAMWNDGAYAWLFGGVNTLTGASYNDTWRWDGATWTRVVGPSPSIRQGTAVAFDSLRGEAVLCGGFAQSALSDTWTFDGTSWLFHNLAVLPPNRWQHGMAFDPVRGRTVLFGGTGFTLSQLRNDTWEWDGVNWTQVITPVNPPAIGTASLGYDARHQRIVMSQSGTQNVAAWAPSLWTYDGITWTPLPVSPALEIQPIHSWMTLPGEVDPTLVDGYSVQMLTDRPATVVATGTGCGGQSPRLWASTVPRPGEGKFGFEIAGAQPLQTVALLLATSPGRFVVGGCPIGVNPSGAALFLPTDAHGAAAMQFPLPASPALLRVSLFAQAFQLAPGTASGFAASPTVRATIGN